MQNSVFSLRCSLQLRLMFVLLLFLSVSVRAEEQSHVCHYDLYREGQSQLQVIEELPEPTSTSDKAYTTVTKGEWEPIRIRVSTQHFEKESAQCRGPHETVSQGSSAQCDDVNVLTSEKKAIMKRVLHSAVKMHATRLQVKPIKYGFKVPNFTSRLCARLAVPTSHKESGVMDSDMVLYASHIGGEKRFVSALGFPCATLSETNRPIVGGIFFMTSDISATEFSVRAVAHEMAHALGFDKRMMSAKMILKNGLLSERSKNVTEVNGTNVVEKVKQHYGCDSAAGMELEDEAKIGLTTGFGSLWEARNAKDELMAGVMRKGYYTNLTLALFEDLSFYKADFSKAEHMDWGYKAGCDFLTKKCITNSKSNFPSMFCTTGDKTTLLCAPDGRSIGKCSFTSAKVPLGHLTNSSFTLNGYDATFFRLMTDGCPFIDEMQGESCTIPRTGNSEDKRGPNSWCLSVISKDSANTQETFKGVCAEMQTSTESTSFLLKNGTKAACEVKTNNVKALTLSTDSATTKFHCPSEEISKHDKKMKKEDILLNSTASDEIKDVSVYDESAFLKPTLSPPSSSSSPPLEPNKTENSPSLPPGDKGEDSQPTEASAPVVEKSVKSTETETTIGNAEVTQKKKDSAALITFNVICFIITGLLMH